MGHNTGSRFDVRQIMYFIVPNAKCSIFSYFAVHWVLSFVKIKFDDPWNWCGWITLLVHKCQDVSTPGAFGDDDWIFEKDYLSNTFQRKILYHVLPIAHRSQWNLTLWKGHSPLRSSPCNLNCSEDRGASLAWRHFSSLNIRVKGGVSKPD